MQLLTYKAPRRDRVSLSGSTIPKTGATNLYAELTTVHTGEPPAHRIDIPHHCVQIADMPYTATIKSLPRAFALVRDLERSGSRAEIIEQQMVRAEPSRPYRKAGDGLCWA
jgi:hypothetical protein